MSHGTEIDINSNNSPLKFWTAIIAGVVTLTGGSGAVSYTMAQEATKATAQATAAKVVEAYKAKNSEQIEKLETKIESNGKAAAEVGRDVDWIRQAIERIEQRQYDQIGNQP